MKALDHYPSNIQDEVLSTLQAYSKVYVYNKNGQYRTSTGIALTAGGYNGEFIESEFRNYDFYTQAEINEFAKTIPDLNW